MTLEPKNHTAYNPDISMGIMMESQVPDIWIFLRWLLMYSVIWKKMKVLFEKGS